MEAKADAAGRALLDDADTKAKAYEDENLRSARRDAREERWDAGAGVGQHEKECPRL